MKAADIMTADVAIVGPDTEVSEIARCLLDRRIGAMPVVDGDGRLLGLVGEGDLIRRAEPFRTRHAPLSLIYDRTRDFIHARGTRARDIMMKEIPSIKPDASIAEIAELMERRGATHLPVLDDDRRVVGIVTRADVLRGIATMSAAKEAFVTASDRAIKDRILVLLKVQAALAPPAVSVIAVNGIVHLWGTTDTEEERDAVRVAAESVVGSENVHNHLSTLAEVLGEVR